LSSMTTFCWHQAFVCRQATCNLFRACQHEIAVKCIFCNSALVHEEMDICSCTQISISTCLPQDSFLKRRCMTLLPLKFSPWKRHYFKCSDISVSPKAVQSLTALVYACDYLYTYLSLSLCICSCACGRVNESTYSCAHTSARL